jgi:hypothetical protein
MSTVAIPVIGAYSLITAILLFVKRTDYVFAIGYLLFFSLPALLIFLWILSGPEIRM